ncbi:hypothetical protein MFMK1_000034 [Metallumcola ferriviriculae]|uniref:Uncharacterized protein n=1 Tax=Metallumcola ferriviriculae TaxID=3039180 RepID=A0AAU0UIF7_9FIRM|nr:hypothetical protein MFMK1_000034 [Desulfitibacteraceae bacterium MK1]
MKNPQKKNNKQEKLKQHSAGDAAETKPPYDPMGTNAEFATEIADGKRSNVTVSVNPPAYVGRGGMKVDRGDPQDNTKS